jgi:hypothetical protein
MHDLDISPCQCITGTSIVTATATAAFAATTTAPAKARAARAGCLVHHMDVDVVLAAHAVKVLVLGAVQHAVQKSHALILIRTPLMAGMHTSNTHRYKQS